VRSDDVATLALVEVVRPRRDVRVLLEESPTLTLGHAAPYAEFDLVVQGVRATLLHYRAMPADDCGLTLRRSAYEQLVGVGRPAQCLRHPGDALLGLDAAKEIPCGREVGLASARTRT